MSTFVFDDYYGDERPGSSTTVPTYLPAVNQWDPIGGTCPSCTLSSNLPITIDASKVQNGTWHSTTVSPGEPETTISITFNGTAVSAYCLLPPNFGTSITSYMNVTFSLDGQLVGKFERIADTDDWTYNSSVFSTSGLENKEHTFVLQPRGDVDTSFIVFDYFTYSWEQPPTPSSSSSVASSSSTNAGVASPTPTSSGTSAHADTRSHKSAAGPIAGGVVAGLAALAAAAFALWFCARRRTRRKGDKIYSGGSRGFSLDLEERNGSPPPRPMPFMAGMSEVGYSSSPSSADALVSRPGPSSSAGPSAYSDTAPSMSVPSSADEKRALQEASLQRMREMEQRIAGGGVVDAAENLEMRREIDGLRGQVEALTAALRLQTEGLKGFDEPPPSYEAGTRVT